MLRLKLQYFDHLIQRADSFEKTLMLGKTKAGGEGDNRGWDGWMASLTQWTWVWVNFRSRWWTGRPGMLLPWGLKESDTTKWLNWTELIPVCTNNESESCSVMSSSLRPHGLYSTWNSPGKNTGVGSLSLLQRIFPTQGSNSHLLNCRWILSQLATRETQEYRNG